LDIEERVVLTSYINNNNNKSRGSGKKGGKGRRGKIETE